MRGGVKRVLRPERHGGVSSPQSKHGTLCRATCLLPDFIFGCSAAIGLGLVVLFLFAVVGEGAVGAGVAFVWLAECTK